MNPDFSDVNRLDMAKAVALAKTAISEACGQLPEPEAMYLLAKSITKETLILALGGWSVATCELASTNVFLGLMASTEAFSDCFRLGLLIGYKARLAEETKVLDEPN